MHAQLVPLLTMALIILWTIAGAAYLVWHFSADDLDPKRLKRTSKGRRSSDK